jgi:hypothetical protein
MTTPEAAMAVVTFSKQLQRARELASEGHRLLHRAHRDLKTGSILIRQSHRNLVDSESILRRNEPPERPVS